MRPSAEQPCPARAGRYLTGTGPEGFFLPAPLPPNPPLHFGPELLARLTAAERALGRLAGAAELLPERLGGLLARREAVLSCRLAGVDISLLELLLAESRPAPDRPPAAVEALRCATALTTGVARMSKESFSVELLRESQARLLGGDPARPTELRQGSSPLPPEPPSCPAGAPAFIPPPPQYLADLLCELETFLQTANELPVLLTIGLAQAQLAAIQPFAAGNGRLGRLLVALLLCADGLLCRPLLPLSGFLLRHRAEYTDRLHHTRDRGDWEGWLVFFLEGIAEAAREAHAALVAAAKMRQKHRLLIHRRLGRTAVNGIKLHDKLLEQPVVSVHQVEGFIGLSFSNANRLVEELTEVGLLKEVTGQRRHRRFAYAPYLALFAEKSEEATTGSEPPAASLD